MKQWFKLRTRARKTIQLGLPVEWSRSVLPARAMVVLGLASPHAVCDKQALVVR